ncbi:MAG: pyridoxamine 5'-phosphate oxidase family protein [Coriobacteriia bacterium]|nr:pyridoxamine 5'-phosphate oxidase family protein [Coriobacteriia bacterium]
MRDTSKTIGKLIDGAGVSIVSSIDKDGFPNSKAMLAPRRREGIRRILFTTNTSSMRVGQYLENPKACAIGQTRG